jgi:UDP-N-acetylmuramoylalanine--D-glutamate ligase
MDANIKALKKFKNVRFVLGKHKLDEIKKAHLIVKHQRLRQDEPEVKMARKLGKVIDSELSIFLQACPCPVIGITGTRGKSTTTAMTHEVLWASRKWREVWLGGNNLVSPLTFLAHVKKNDLVVLEVSSFQLEGTGEAGVSPHIAVWTNLMRDHLNAYPSMVEYAEAKAQIFRHQDADDVVFFPTDKSFDEYAKEAPGNVVRVKKEKFVLSIPGEHNQMNASFAAAVAKELGVPSSKIKSALKKFKGLPNRMETIAVKNGVKFINDTTATTPDGTIAALSSYGFPKTKTYTDPKANFVHLIFGGADKELEFDEVSKALAKRTDVAVYLLPGTAQEKITKAFKKAGFGISMNVKDMEEAFTHIKSFAKRGDVVLLSPGCASFGLFKNEFDRGEQFKKLVKKWK